MYHWDLPQTLQDMGGWLNPLIVDCCEDYADLLFNRFGNKVIRISVNSRSVYSMSTLFDEFYLLSSQVKWWITINEPHTMIFGYDDKNFAPNLHLGSPANYIVAHNCLKAHGRIFRLYEKKYRVQQQGKTL